MKRVSSFVLTFSILLLIYPLNGDNPPPGIPVPDSIRKELEGSLTKLGHSIEQLRLDLADKPNLSDLIPDVVIYFNAVRYALIHDQFYRVEKPNEFEVAADLINTGLQRAQSLRKGRAPWTRQTGLVVRGYTSKVDGSVQPYGLEIPDTYDFKSSEPQRLDVWYHGRGNTLSEIKFIHDRESEPGKFQSPDTIVLHPFGRYCNANKFAGEVDTFEAVESISKHYRIDSRRIAVRGFSMGGAVAWHMATHHADRWIAAAPGAGFAETAIYANVMNKSPSPAWYELKLHSLYDATKYARNLFHCPTIAYSGSEDKQKQAADIMSEYMKAEKLDLLHVIGQGMGHKYDEQSIRTINNQVQRWASAPIDTFPKEVRFTTYTLRYNRMHWITVDTLEEHWKRSDVTATIVDGEGIDIQTRNINGLTLQLSSERVWNDDSPHFKIVIDGEPLAIVIPRSDNISQVALSKADGNWTSIDQVESPALKKTHGLQGPIDDAFMTRFLFVEPTGSGSSKAFDEWVDRERKEAVLQWWRQFRGEALTKLDSDVTQDDIENCNLILWGDPASNQILARIQSRLPFNWEGNTFQIGDKAHSTDQYAPVMIYPNPLNPKRYIVINSGFTFSKFSGGSNSLQVPKLPDWAVIDIKESKNTLYPVGVADAGFFDEFWRFKNRPQK